MLLGMTLAFSAVTATVSMVLQLPTFMYLVFVLVGFGLPFVVNRMAVDSAKGLPAIFAFTGVMGAALARYSTSISACPTNGPNLVLQLAGWHGPGLFWPLRLCAAMLDFHSMRISFAGLLFAVAAMVANIWAIQRYHSPSQLPSS